MLRRSNRKSKAHERKHKQRHNKLERTLLQRIRPLNGILRPRKSLRLIRWFVKTPKRFQRKNPPISGIRQPFEKYPSFVRNVSGTAYFALASFHLLISAIICLGCSAIFHWFSAHSEKTNDILARLDYAGISILVAGSCYPPYYFFFYCEQFYRTVYLAFISIFAASVFLYSFQKNFNKPQNRKFRGSLFLTLGISAAIPIIHLIFLGY